MSVDTHTAQSGSRGERRPTSRFATIGNRLRTLDANGRAMVLALTALGVAMLWLVISGIAGSALPTGGPGQALRWSIVLGGLLMLPPLSLYLILKRLFSDDDRRFRETRTSRNIFKSFFSEADEVFFVCDTEGRFRTINPAGIRFLGIDPVWERLKLQDLVVQHDTVAADEIFMPPFADDRHTIELQVVTNDGNHIDTVLHVLHHRDSLGRVIGMQFRATTAEDEPVEEVETQTVNDLQVRSLIEHYPDGVALLTLDGHVRLTNNLGDDYLADYGTFLAGQRLVLFGGIPIDQLVEDGRNPRRQEVIVREPYHQILEVHGRLLGDHANHLALLVIRDVTTEQQRRERLERSDRLAAVGQLAAGIAHDFKNILQGINLCAELSRSNELSKAEHRDSMLTIIEQANRGSKLIQQIMDFTRQSESTQRLLDLGSLLRETTELLKPGIAGNVEVRLDLPEGDHPVMADPGQLQQVIANLMLNAGQAMADGGLLAIALSKVGGPDDAGPVPLEAQSGDWLRISVSDTGGGIPRSVQHRVFEPFFTTKSARGGTGLGLAQVYGNVQQHGGHIEFETSEGIGTTFFVFLPMYTHHRRAESSTDDQDSLPRGNGETVLVVDDEIAVLTVTAQSLRSLGYNVLEATDGTDAQRFVDDGTKIDLMLTDVRIPGVDGLQMAKRIARQLPSIKVLVMTGHASQISSGGESPEGAVGVLFKPFSMAHLAREVKQALVS